MKVFISWSGELSQKVAEALYAWLPAVIQTVRPFVSSDTNKGSRWHDVVARELEGSNFGILCITHENVYRPWLNFEAGALSKSIEKSHVSPFLIDIKPTDITGPLTQFQSTNYAYADVFRLVKSMNSTLEAPVGDLAIEQIFRAMWPQLKEPIDRAIKDAADTVKPVVPMRTVEEMLAELLDLARMQQKVLTCMDMVPQPGASGALATKSAGRGKVDSTEAVYLFSDALVVKPRMRQQLQAKPETASMVQIRALADLIIKSLAPAIDVN